MHDFHMTPAHRRARQFMCGWRRVFSGCVRRWRRGNLLFALFAAKCSLKIHVVLTVFFPPFFSSSACPWKKVGFTRALGRAPTAAVRRGCARNSRRIYTEHAAARSWWQGSGSAVFLFSRKRIIFGDMLARFGDSPEFPVLTVIERHGST